MIGNQLTRAVRFAAIFALAAALFSAFHVSAQQNSETVKTKHVSTQSVTLAWGEGGRATEIYIRMPDGSDQYVGDTTAGQYMLTGLSHGRKYRIMVRDPQTGRSHWITVRTKLTMKRSKEAAPISQESSPVDTCAQLPAEIVVTGYDSGTQCRLVGVAGVGRSDLIGRGVIHAVDLWGYVNGGVEICFRHGGSLVILDADYAPRMLMDLASYQRNGMTCAAVDREGTVVLLRSGATTAQPPTAQAPVQDAAPATSPAFDAVPLNECLIKLTETLFLRARPGGEIIGLVWLNSEVPVFEVDGHWYKIEFEGQVGYISRFYRKVLRGGCG